MLRLVVEPNRLLLCLLFAYRYIIWFVCGLRCGSLGLLKIPLRQTTVSIGPKRLIFVSYESSCVSVL
jgi:hypothetical protein